MNKNYFLLWGLIMFLIFGSLITYGLCYKKKHPYLKVEHLIEKKAEEYLEDYNGIKPNKNIEVTITTDELLNTAYINKEELKYKNKKCSGKVIVSYEKNKYKYKTNIKCK